MKGDFSRVTFDPARQFSRVLMQQGRVLLDADFNEQVAILLHYMQTLAADIIGPAGGPQAASGFGIVDLATLSDADKQRLGIAEPRDLSGDFIISPGRYYIDGVLVENPRYALFTNQAGMTSPPLQKQNATYTTLIYLEAWERHVTAIEEPEIREVALGGPDTT